MVILGFLLHELWEKIEVYREANRKEVIVAAPEISVVGIEDFSRDRKDYFVVDIREKEEYEQGHFVGAKNIRLGDLLGIPRIRDILREESKEKKLLFFCHDGERSKMAANRMLQEKNTTIYLIEKGFEQLRADTKLAETLWKGTLKYVLPYGFWANLPSQAPSVKTIETKTVVNVIPGKKLGGRLLEGKEIIHAPLMLLTSEQADRLMKMLGTQPATPRFPAFTPNCWPIDWNSRAANSTAITLFSTKKTAL